MCYRVEKEEVIKQISFFCKKYVGHGDMGDLHCLLHTFLGLAIFLSVRSWEGKQGLLGVPQSCLEQFSNKMR